MVYLLVSAVESKPAQLVGNGGDDGSIAAGIIVSARIKNVERCVRSRKGEGIWEYSRVGQQSCGSTTVR